MYTTKASFHEEPLPFDTYIPKNADKIILGTFPTKKSLRKFDFFYPNTSNKFWRVLGELIDHKLVNMSGDAAVDERKGILDGLELAITDMGHVIYRQNESSLDANIFPVEFTDIFQIIDDHPKIRTVIVTSSTKGSSVLSWFAAYCQLNGIELKKPGDAKVPWQITIHNSGKAIKVIVVYSTSGAAYIDETALKEMYRMAIMENSTI